MKRSFYVAAALIAASVSFASLPARADESQPAATPQPEVPVIVQPQYVRVCNPYGLFCHLVYVGPPAYYYEPSVLDSFAFGLGRGLGRGFGRHR